MYTKQNFTHPLFKKPKSNPIKADKWEFTGLAKLVIINEFIPRRIVNRN
jgi:hypothetical protein